MADSAGTTNNDYRNIKDVNNVRPTRTVIGKNDGGVNLNKVDSEHNKATAGSGYTGNSDLGKADRNNDNFKNINAGTNNIRTNQDNKIASKTATSSTTDSRANSTNEGTSKASSLPGNGFSSLKGKYRFRINGHSSSFLA